jgi:HEAT repeat protein
MAANFSTYYAAFTSRDDDRAEAAVQALAALGPAARPALDEWLADPDLDARWWAARALAEIDDPQVPALLRRALGDPDPDVRLCAALGLRRRPSPEAIPDLAQRLDSGDRLLARLAADALIAAGSASTPALLQVMENGSPAARLEAVRALAGIGDTSAIPALFAALDEESALVEYWANEGLERMGVGMAFFKP